MTFEPNEPQPQPELALLTGGLDVNQPVEESVLPGYLVEPFLAEESNELEARPVALRLNLAETWKQLFSNEVGSYRASEPLIFRNTDEVRIDQGQPGRQKIFEWFVEPTQESRVYGSGYV